ncbi:type VII secretion protein EccB [Microbacterium sp. cx-55]|uniref:type VII secretion protein EccB n=1 Tax=unclassified Microbacterium TaxID=2609290 RepID=UPI001CBF8693|nr:MULTISPECIES: type VII secretion protein EccB [unclassified Microbacterium]MBZ4488306.1 type VII secretion protein EccB [Microbacterium sp. cx-55]MCC4909365.1 type VII secretion protein EccB [Microbacterium sp. cx-59]UGB34965.1 type VII secretion protein EccB [Microbacterium sp. cx-55]
MATKNDLIEAQTFSRRRLLTAFISGAPGGKELEPTAPLRAVIAAIALTVAVILVGVFWGLIRPGLPNGWENGKLILVSDTGARFVTVEGALHPVINTASARLLLPSEDFAVISTDQSNLQGVALGSTLGIVGAPDELPAPDRLQNAGWSACVTDDAGVDVQIGAASAEAAAGRAVVVESDGERYVIDGERSYAVGAGESDAILRAAGITALNPVDVSSDWLNLFTPGTPLEPLVVAGKGNVVPGADLAVGDVVHLTGTAETERLLVQSNGELAELSPLAWQLYQLGAGASATPIDVSGADISGLGTSARPAGGEDWPASGFQSIDGDERACALLVDDGTEAHSVLAVQSADTEASAGVHVEPGTGALLRAGGRGEQSTGIVTLVDATGTAYPLPGATEETVARLGYQVADIGPVGDVWIDLLKTGPALSEDAAGTSPSMATPAG